MQITIGTSPQTNLDLANDIRLVRAAILYAKGELNVSDFHIDRTKHVPLATDLVSKLPRLDEVPIHEIIDIRRELEGPLVRFRSALIEYSEEINSAPWEQNFKIEAEQLFRNMLDQRSLT